MKRVERDLAVVALTLATAALLAGDPAAPGAASLGAIAREIDEERDHVEPIELARWIRDGRPGLRVIDVRAPAAFAEYSIPTAENFPVQELIRARLPRDAVIALYSEGSAHAGQAWVLLRSLGYSDVYVVREGLFGWLHDVIDPVLPADASAAARIEFAGVAELSRYFGGTPRISAGTASPARDEAIAPPARAEPESDAGGAVRAIRRRGC